MSLPIPREAFDYHSIFLGKTGSGKSSAMRIIVERLLDESKAVTIIDPKGDWWGLKSSADGKHPGYPLVIFGGAHADVPLNPRSGAQVAELISTGNRPAIIELRGWMPAEMAQFWIDFASMLYKTTRGRRWLVIDEAHNFAPKGQTLDPKSSMSLHWSKRLAAEGRGLGVNLMAASQRPQKVHNDFLTSCETLVAMRVVHKSDRDALNDWIEGCGDVEIGSPDEVKKCKEETDHAQVGKTGFCRCRKRMYVVESLAQMKRGEAWGWCPELGFGPERVHFPLFKTYDSFKPQNTEQPAKLKGWADVDLIDVTKKLEAVVKEAEANDPAKLRARIRELEMSRKLDIPTSTKVVIDEKATHRAIAQAIREVRDFYEPQLTEAMHRLNAWEKTRKLTGEAWGPVNATCSTKFEVKLYKVSAGEIQHKGEARQSSQSSHGNEKTATESHPRPIIPPVPSDGELTGAAKRILEAVAQTFPEPQSFSQVGVIAGISTKTSTWRAGMAFLRANGYTAEPSKKHMVATGAGIAAIGGVPASKTAAERVEMWRSKFSGAALKMFDVLIGMQGHAIQKETLGATAEVDPATSTWRAAMAVLRKAKVIEESHEGIRAVESLF